MRDPAQRAISCMPLSNKGFMNPIQKINALGQSIWYDNVSKSLIASGELQRLIDSGVTGVTSNPTIFEKAIAGTTDYDAEIGVMAASGATANEIYESLATTDIAHGADVLRPVYDRTDGADGFISFEVSPLLAHDSTGSIAEGRRLFARLGKPNVMIKIPATPEGVPAIRALIGAGINVNVTLIFDVEQYGAVAEAYLCGLEDLAASNGNLHSVASVASFFVSRVDGAVDAVATPALQGKAAVANARLAYVRFQEIFSGPRWQALAAMGAHVQRPLWASTGTKNAKYSDVLYVDNLIGANTVNTVPPATLKAILDHSVAKLTISDGVGQAILEMGKLADENIIMHNVAEKLQVDGVASFAKSFDSLMASIETKRVTFHSAHAAQTNGDAITQALVNGIREQSARSMESHSEVF